ncbi:MAG: PLP-dependent cysteine synthase family protein [Bacteroidota bacterium]
MIGNTPLLGIHLKFRGSNRVIYAKAENVNMTGSIKDRMAYHIITKAYEEDKLHQGDTIVEATSGNTGISFSAIGRALGHPVVIFMPDWMSRERVELIRSLGAKIVPVSHEEGGFLGSVRLSEELAKNEKTAFLPQQFSNGANVEAHATTTGPEIWWQLFYHSLKPDAFVSGVGTGGTIMGVGKFLNSKNASVKIFPLEPAESPTMSTGHKVGKHRIQGITDEFIPPIVQLDKFDEILAVHDGDAIIMAQKLASEIGLGMGISSGANLIGALMAQNKLGNDAIVVTVLPDDNKKYLSTDLLRNEPVKDGYISPDVELLGYEAFKRVCYTCCDREECMERYPVTE